MKRVLLLLLFLIVAVPANATIALVQHVNKDTSGTSTTLAYTSSPTANNLLVGIFRAGGNAALPYTITDTIGNTWHGLTSHNVTGIGSLQIFWSTNSSTAADTVTFAISGSSTTLRMAIYEYSGVSTSCPLDVENNSNSGTGTATTANTITPGGNNELIIAASSNGGAVGDTYTAGTNYTLRDSVPASPTVRLGVEDWIQTTATATNGPLTLNQSDNWMNAIAAFRPAGASCGTTPIRHHTVQN